MSKVIILVPKTDLIGGIANYYASLRPYLPSDIKYFVRGGRGYKNKTIRGLFIIYDIIRFSVVLLFSEPDLVVINTSIGKDGLRRDSVLLRIAKNVFQKKSIVFFRGWENTFFQKNRVPNWFSNTFLQCDKIIVLSNEFKNQLINIGYSGQIILETTVVDRQLLFTKSSIPRPESAFSILFLSRIEVDKGIYDILEAVKMLQNGNDDIFLDIAGEGSEIAKAKKYVENEKIENVTFHGFVNGFAKAELFRTASVYVFPSSHGEGMPNSVLEAMAFGLPVLTTRVGGIADFFNEGEMGFYIESRNIPNLNAQLLKLINSPDLCNRISNYNKEYARNEFFSDKVAARLISYF